VQAEPIGPVYVDKALLRQCCALGFEEAQLSSDLKTRKATRGTITYYVALTSRAHFNKDDYLQGQLCESSQLQLQHPTGIMLAAGDDQQGCGRCVHAGYTLYTLHSPAGCAEHQNWFTQLILLQRLTVSTVFTVSSRFAVLDTPSF
jgi:hypothetical protein